MGRVELSRRIGRVVAYPPLCDMSDLQRREFHKALLEANDFADLPGKWQAAILEGEQSRPQLWVSAAAEPGLQHLNLPPEAVGLAHRRERLGGGLHARARQGVQRR
jgi:hypothetical protein